MLCPLSALNPSGGPGRLIDCEDLDPLSARMSSEVVSYGEVPLDLPDVTAIVSSALRLTLPPPEYSDVYDLAPKLPEGISDWIHSKPIGIGYFDEDNGECPANEQGRYPSGRDVEIRRLEEYDGYGYFYSVIVEGEGGGDVSIPKRSCCRPWEDCSFFILGGCLEYLRAWLDATLPPRVAFMDSAPSMSLEGELYEILNSRHEKREGSGLLPRFEYGEISTTLEQDQFRFLNARKGSHHLSRAITAGLKEAELLPAMFADFQCWQSMRPDTWPFPSSESSHIPIFTQYLTSLTNSNPFKILPAELLLEIFNRLPIHTILTLSSASRSLRGLITEPPFINQIIKTAVLSGTEFWVLPVASLVGEKERAWDAASKWLTPTTASSKSFSPLSNLEDADHDNTRTTESPFLSPSFPYLPFLHACYTSDSMRNRQRLWKVVKQFDVLWKDYRLNGWQRNIFAV